MKIFYAVQATGNGHISRAMELLPHLQKYGEVAVFLSGNNASLSAQLPIAFRNKGISLFYSQNGHLDLVKTAQNIDLYNIYKTAKQLPLENYDLIINDFEAICSIACRIKNLPSVHFGHQASFASELTPRPEHKNASGEFILKNFAKSKVNVGLHFKSYDDFILPPVIKSEIWNATPKNENYVTVYLPSYDDAILLPFLQNISPLKFEVFSKQVQEEKTIANCTFIPVDKTKFNNSLIHCKGIITNAGFETPAEAMYLNKKIFAIPIGGQYEQECNAAAMQLMGAYCIPKIEADFSEKIKDWLSAPAASFDTNHFLPTEQIVAKMMNIASQKAMRNKP